MTPTPRWPDGRIPVLLSAHREELIAADAAAILAVPHVNGGLVGGASLKAADFLAIVRAAVAALRGVGTRARSEKTS